MFVVVDIANDDRQRVGAADRGIAAVFDYNRHQVFLLLFSVKPFEACNYSRTMTIVAAT